MMVIAYQVLEILMQLTGNDLADYKAENRIEGAFNSWSHGDAIRKEVYNSGKMGLTAPFVETNLDNYLKLK